MEYLSQFTFRQLIYILYLVCLNYGFVKCKNLRPIIGIVSQRSYESAKESYIQASYVGYLEGSGARVVPIRSGMPQSYYENIFSQINGVLFPGGGANLISSNYARSGRFIYDLAIQANNAGDYFPLWGTCLGFELLTNLTAHQNLLINTDSENLPLPLNIIDSAAEKSRLFGSLPSEIKDALTQKPTTYNNHQYSITPKTFNGTKSLNTFYTVLSTNRDRGGIQFVSAIEAKKYPIYGVQWHPEKNNFIWSPKLNIDHTEIAVKVSQYFANFFVSEARKSSHRFKNSTLEIRAMIDNYKRVYQTDGTYNVDYYFDVGSYKDDPFL